MQSRAQHARSPFGCWRDLNFRRYTTLLAVLTTPPGLRPRREASRAISPNQTRPLGKPVGPRAATCRSQSARRRRASRHRRVRAGRLPWYRNSGRPTTSMLADLADRIPAPGSAPRGASKPASGFGGTRNVWRWGEDRSSGRSARNPAGQHGGLALIVELRCSRPANRAR
jgi:hypothetical protein